MNQSRGTIDIYQDELSIDTSYVLHGDTMLKHLFISKNAALNLAGHRLLVEGWAHLEGPIVSYGPVMWAVLRSWLWLKRKCD